MVLSSLQGVRAFSATVEPLKLAIPRRLDSTLAMKMRILGQITAFLPRMSGFALLGRGLLPYGVEK